MLFMWRRRQLVVPLVTGSLFILTTIATAAPTGSVDPRCTLEPFTGRCRAAFPGVYFDADSGTCKRFTYGGCGGNGLIFYCLEECDIVCVQRKDINDFVDEFEQILTANLTTEPNTASKATGDSRTHLLDDTRPSLSGVLAKSAKQDHIQAGSLWIHSKPEHNDKKADSVRLIQTEYQTPPSKYICPLQEAFEGDSAAEEDRKESAASSASK